MADPQESGGRGGFKCWMPRQHSLTSRMIYTIALIPIVPAIATIGRLWCTAHVSVGSFDDLRWFHFWSSILWVGLSVLVWRSVVNWTLGRVWLTMLVSTVPFIQVVIAQPIWTMPSSGWFDFGDVVKRFGQHELGVGAWVWLIVWVWWGWERYSMTRERQVSPVRAVALRGNVRRAIMSIGSLPVVVGVMAIDVALLEDFTPLNPGATQNAVLYALVGIVAAVIWLLIWRGAVCWSRKVWSCTLLFAAGLILIPTLLLYWFEALPSATRDYLVAIPFLAWGLWMGATVGYWPMRHRAGVSGEITPTCLVCGYALIGLCATRCPECGDERTIDELWRAHAGEDL